MESIWQLINEWEIQFLVLLSFILQVFLFFTGSLRRSTRNPLLRATIWAAYLGADMVAIYALGYLSRHEDATKGNCSTLKGTHLLTSFWAPFLLIHLGGPDTITAFAIEDNNLWLRHLLNLIVQVALALYVFWKSDSWQNTYLLVPGVLLFVVGIIKYGERTVALFLGNPNNIKQSTCNEGNNILSQYLWNNDNYGLVCTALMMEPSIRELFSRRSTYNDDNDLVDLASTTLVQKKMVIKLVDIELGIIMYNDLYTKAALLRTRSGIILRCISQLCTIVALVVFVVGNNKAEYGIVDVVITYILFIGGILLELCAVLTMFMASPWTWAWLKSRQYGSMLAGISWYLLSSDQIGWLGTRALWSNTMGQYSFLRYMGSDNPVTFSQRVMSLIRRMARAISIGAIENKLFWLSKLLDTEYEAVDDMITECLVEEISRLRNDQQKWPHIGKFFQGVETSDFVGIVCTLHLITEFYLSEAFPTTTSNDRDIAALVSVCRKLSNYMFYLVVAHPVAGSMLQVATNDPGVMVELMRSLLVPASPPRLTEMIIEEDIKSTLFPTEKSSDALEELKRMWVRILIYTAGKSRPEVHAAQLAKGGELLTFIWLLMAHHGLGDCFEDRVELPDTKVRRHVYAFNLPETDDDGSISDSNAGVRFRKSNLRTGVELQSGSSTSGVQQGQPIHLSQPFSKRRTSWLHRGPESMA